MPFLGDSGRGFPPLQAPCLHGKLYKEHVTLRQEGLMDKRELLRDVELFVLDMDGTFYLGDRILDGSLAFLERVRATAGCPIRMRSMILLPTRIKLVPLAS